MSLRTVIGKRFEPQLDHLLRLKYYVLNWNIIYLSFNMLVNVVHKKINQYSM